ncbi:MAG: type II CRISPR RNA-guided endonuclease Cas9 [Brumimicrobium sp.]|nr:type II CRISPR RNA-guided endonuclease Cas9 [Brumimicrobium sp.]
MAKKILGLDLGTTSIGWAYIIEGEKSENSSIEQIGVRVNPLTVDEQNDFEKGKPLSTNANRTLKRGARRNLDRYQDRRKNLIQILKDSTIINLDSTLTEDGKDTTFDTWRVRAKSVSEKITKDEFARVLLAINKKRGYKSSRKAKNEDEGQAIDGMAIAKRLYDEHLTPGQFVFSILKSGKKYVPDFYRSDLQAEFDTIWNFQKQFHPEILTEEFYQDLKGKGQRATSALFWVKYEFNTADIKDLEDSLLNERTAKLNLRDKKKLQAYKWRSEAVTKKMEREQLAYVLTEINSNLNNSSGYLGAISDRSKELYFNKETVGQYLYKQLKENRHNKLKNQVFYRQDYLDEFEAIWTEQSKHYPELTDKLKSEIRDVVIFYQRKLKSQKGLISFCELESKKIIVNGKEKNVGLRVAPKSSHLFQEYKIWQRLNDVVVRKKGSKKRKLAKDLKLTDEERELFALGNDEKQLLFNELNLKGNILANKVIEILGLKPSEWEINFTALDGNLTNRELYNAFLKIIDLEGYDVKDILKVKSNKDEVELDDLSVSADNIKEMVKSIFESLEIDTSILEFNAELDEKLFENQASYQLWHLLYSYEGDNSQSGNETLYSLLEKKYNFKREHAQILANIVLQDDYGSLSTKALRRIYPHIKENNYSTACELAGYRHSKHSLTKEELENRQLKDKLQLLPKNSLRNPVVEKILNQMVNVVNTLIDKENDKLEQKGLPRNFHFDEIRVELARELKKNAAERKELDQQVRNGKTRNEKIAKIIQTEFGIPNPTRNDIIRYRLYEELKNNGYKDLYTNTYINKELIFSKEIDIEHIIPQSRLFDDSFSNKTLAFRKDNLKKDNRTATDYIKEEFGEANLEAFEQRVENLYKLAQKNPEEGISKAKYKKLLMTQSEIGDGFIERDLRETQYIAKKAKEMLFEITKAVVSTSGSITDRLRDDWDLINVMKEINFPKYRALGLTEWQERKGGKKVEVIKDWTKRNDHRHHAMDALTVAFTKRSHIQYLNNLNARRGDKFEDGIRNTDDNYSIETADLKISTNDVLGIERKELYRDEKGKLRFNLPIPNFRQIVKEHLEGVIISHKAKNKVVTKNKNKISGKSTPQVVLTPRGQLHKETVYGQYHFYESKMEKIGPKFDENTINMVANPTYRRLLLERLQANDRDPKKAFGGKNALSKTPIYVDEAKTKVIPESIQLSWLTKDFSIRKDVTPDNFKDEKSIDKVVDGKVKEILKARLKEYGDAKKAFSELDKNPIWLNKEKGITIKRVTISGVSNALALHNKKDHFGNEILDKNEEPIPVDFVSTGNNHHVAVYRDEKGNLQDNVVSFFEAVERVNQGLPIIDKSYNRHLGWKFLFTMKQNEMFVFPNEKMGFDPQEVDLLDPKNKSLISPNLFRVQKMSKVSYGNSAVREFVFRHHIETSVDEKKELKELTFKNIKSLGYFEGIIKIRTNHLGDIVGVGEY